MTKPKIVTLCGSSRFKEQHEIAQREETLLGKIVIPMGMYGHLEGLDMDGLIKVMLDELHFRKIDISSEIFVVNPGGYVGQSTGNEIRYAFQNGKMIRWWEMPKFVPEYLTTSVFEIPDWRHCMGKPS